MEFKWLCLLEDAQKMLNVSTKEWINEYTNEQLRGYEDRDGSTLHHGLERRRWEEVRSWRLEETHLMVRGCYDWTGEMLPTQAEESGNKKKERWERHGYRMQQVISSGSKEKGDIISLKFGAWVAEKRRKIWENRKSNGSPRCFRDSTPSWPDKLGTMGITIISLVFQCVIWNWTYHI